MKKYLLTALLSLAISLIISTPVLAASVSFSPSSINIVNGRDATAVIMINPQGAPIYTAKVEINFPRDLVAVKSFTLANNWMALTQSGFDSTDNLNGILIKSAGYPGGISAPVALGTIVFSTKAPGTGVISSTGNSLVYDANSQNVLSGSARINLAISRPVVIPAPRVTPAPAPAPEPVVQPTPEPVVPQENIPEEVPEQLTETQQASILSAFGKVLTLGTDNNWIGIITTIIILIVLYYVIVMLMKRSKGKKKSE